MTEPQSQRERADLPAARAETETASSASFVAASRSQVLDAPFPLAPDIFMSSVATEPTPSGQPPSLPSKPGESPYEISGLPPLPIFKDPGYTNGNGHAHVESPAPLPVPEVNRLEGVLPITDFPNGNTPSSPPPAAPSSVPSPSGPVWPGLDLDEVASQVEEAPEPPVEAPPEPVAPAVPPPARTPMPPARRRVFGRLALVSAITLCAGWLLWQKNHTPHSSSVIATVPVKPVVAPAPPAPAPLPPPIPRPSVASKLPSVASAPVPASKEPKVPMIASVPAPAPLHEEPKAPAVTSVPAPTPVHPGPKVPVVATAPPPIPVHVEPKAPVIASAPAPAPVLPKPPQPPEVIQHAEPVSSAPPDDSAILESAAKIVTAIDAAATTKERLALVADPDQNRTAVEDFFKAHQEPLQASSPEASTGYVVLLPGGKEAKMFRLITQRCPEGALLYFHTNNGKTLLDWPLFMQSHEHLYDHFVVSNDVNHTTPQWFPILCRRTHASTLKGPDKDQWIAVDAQGSLSASGAAVVYFDKNTPAGRYLEKNLNWDRIYLIDLKLGKKIIEGHGMNVVLDCGGTRNSEPANGQKK